MKGTHHTDDDTPTPDNGIFCYIYCTDDDCKINGCKKTLKDLDLND